MIHRTLTPTPVISSLTLGLSLALAGCFGPKEKVISIYLPPQPNQHAQYVCETQPGPTEELKLSCASGFQEYTSHQIVNLKEEVKGCANSAARIWLVVSKKGEIVRVQYQCGAQESGEFPEE